MRALSNTTSSAGASRSGNADSSTTAPASTTGTNTADEDVFGSLSTTARNYLTVLFGLPGRFDSLSREDLAAWKTMLAKILLNPDKNRLIKHRVHRPLKSHEHNRARYEIVYQGIIESIESDTYSKSLCRIKLTDKHDESSTSNLLVLMETRQFRHLCNSQAMRTNSGRDIVKRMSAGPEPLVTPYSQDSLIRQDAPLLRPYLDEENPLPFDDDTLIEGYPVLILASGIGMMEILDKAIAQGLNLDIRHPEKDVTAFQRALRNGQFAFAKKLSQHGAEIRFTNTYDQLIDSAGSGDADLFKAVLDSYPQTVFSEGMHKVMQVLIEKQKNDMIMMLARQWQGTGHGFFVYRMMDQLARHDHNDLLPALLALIGNISELPEETGHSVFTSAIEDSQLAILDLIGDRLRTHSEEAASLAPEAAKHRHIAGLMFLIDHGVDVVSGRDVGNATALLCAAYQGEAQRVRILLSLVPHTDAYLNAEDSLGQNALTWAIHNTNTEAAKLILAALSGCQADLNVKTASGYNALALAINLGNTDLLQTCLEQYTGPGKMDLNTKTLAGSTLLEIAARNNSAGCAALLLPAMRRQVEENIRPVEIYRQECEQALMVAIRDSALEVVRLMLPELLRLGSAFNTGEEVSGITALGWAARLSNLPILDLLMAAMHEAGASLDVRIDGSFNALGFAVKYGQLAVIKRLLPHIRRGEIDLVGGEPDGMTNLSLAASYGHTRIIDLLLPILITRSTKNPDLKKETAMICEGAFYQAVTNGENDIIARILSLTKGAGIDIDYDKNRRRSMTALGLAVETGKIDTAKLIISILENAGVSLDLRNESGLNALGTALLRGDPDMTGLLLPYARQNKIRLSAINARKEPLLITAARGGSAACLALLLPALISRAGNSGSRKDLLIDDYEDALVVAAWHGRSEFIRELLASPLSWKANLNQRNSISNTPLIQAIAGHHIAAAREILPVLKKQQLSINTRNEAGMNALDVAISNQDRDSIVLLLPELKTGSIKLHMTSDKLGPLLLQAAEQTWPGTPGMPTASDIVDLILQTCIDTGISLEAKNDKGQTARDLLIENGHIAIAAKLKRAIARNSAILGRH